MSMSSSISRTVVFGATFNGRVGGGRRGGPLVNVEAPEAGITTTDGGGGGGGRGRGPRGREVVPVDVDADVDTAGGASPSGGAMGAMGGNGGLELTTGVLGGPGSDPVEFPRSGKNGSGVRGASSPSSPSETCAASSEMTRSVRRSRGARPRPGTAPLGAVPWTGPAPAGAVAVAAVAGAAPPPANSNLSEFRRFSPAPAPAPTPTPAPAPAPAEATAFRPDNEEPPAPILPAFPPDVPNLAKSSLALSSMPCTRRRSKSLRNHMV